jgi:hypothetical protein
MQSRQMWRVSPLRQSPSKRRSSELSSSGAIRAIVSLLVDKIHGMSRIIEMSASIGRQKQEERKQKRDRRKSPSSRRIRKTSEQMPSN